MKALGKITGIALCTSQHFFQSHLWATIVRVALVVSVTLSTALVPATPGYSANPTPSQAPIPHPLPSAHSAIDGNELARDPVCAARTEKGDRIADVGRRPEASDFVLTLTTGGVARSLTTWIARCRAPGPQNRAASR